MSTAINKYMLNGLTDQGSNKILIKLFKSDASTLIIAGYALRDATSISVSHASDNTPFLGSDGETCAVLSQNDRVTISVTFIPFGASKTAAAAAASLPAGGFLMGMSFFPTITVGTTVFTDLNTHATDASSPQYIYNGDGSLQAANTGGYSMSFSATRYAGIANPVAVTS